MLNFCSVGRIEITWLMTTRFGGALQAPITGKMFGCEKMRNFGNSSLKSREMRALQSRTDRIFATMSFFCQRPRHVSPDGAMANFVCNSKSRILMPLYRESVASRERVFSPNQLWSLKLIFRNSCPLSMAKSCKRFARNCFVLSKGVSPSLLATDTNAPWLTSSSAIAW